MAKKKKKKLKPGESYTRKNRPKGVSKREWDKARKAEGLDPRAKFFADPEPARQRARKAKLSAQEKKQADKFVAEYQKQSQQQPQQNAFQKSPLEGTPYQLPQQQQSQQPLSPQETAQADSFIESFKGKVENFRQTAGPKIAEFFNRPDKEVAQDMKELVAPNRGFSEEDIKKAKPTGKETFSAIVNYPGDIAREIADPLSEFLFPKSESQKDLEEKAQKERPKEYAKRQEELKSGPKTPGEAKVFQKTDIATFLLGSIKSLKGAALVANLSKAKDTKLIKSLLAGKFTDDEIKILTPKIKGTTSADEIKGFFNEVTPKPANPLTKPPVKPQSVPVKKGITVESMMADEVKATKARELAHKANVEEFIQPKVSDKRPKLDTYAAKKEYSDSLWSKTRTALQDSWVKAKNIERTKGVVKGKGVSPYEAETLFHGRIGARLENLVRTTEKFDRNVIATSKKLNNPNFSKQVDEYAQALHAPERNAVHGEGAAGMTNAQAKKVMAKVETSGNAKAIKQASTELIERNKETLKNLYEGQLINKETFDRLTKIYKNHVPLNRVMDEGDDIVSIMTGGKGFNIEGSGLKRAKGSEREVSDIMTNVHANLAEAITRSEKNKVGLSTLEFARNNKKLGFFEEIKPKAIGETFDGKPILQKVNDPNVLKVMEKGKPVYLKIHDPSLAAMYQGIGKDVLPDMFRPVEAITRYYSSMATRFNPEFGLSNKIRDLQEVIVNIFAMKKGGAKGVGNVLKNEAKSWKHVTDWMMGKDSEGARLYEQMRLDGGTTGGMSLSTRKKLDIDIAKIQKINRSNPRRGMEMLFNGLENWNTVIEDSTRLSVYKAGLTNGATREQAAIMAKNASLNFNKKGTAGPVVNALWMFSNASIQGTTNILRSFKNPKVAGTVATMVGSATYAINKWNDSINLDWREEFSEWDQNSNFPIAIPNKNGEVKYMTIPVSWGVKPMKVMADQFYQVGTGKQKNAVDAAKKIALSAIDAYNPAGGTTLQSTLAPTVIDMPLDILTNTSWSGNLVKPDWMTGLPQADQHFKSLEDSSTGKFLIGATGKLSEATDREIDVSPQDANYVLNNMIGGGGKFVKRVFNSVSGLASGEGTDAKNIPFLNRFYKSLDKENIEKGKVRRTREDAMDSFKKFKTGSEEQKKAIQEYVMSVPEGEERTRELMIIGDDTGLDLKGVTSSDAVYRMRPVTDELAKLRAEGKEKEAEDIINGLTRDDYTTLKGIESRAFKEKEGMSKTESIKKQYATDTKELSLPEKAKMIYKKIQVGEEVESEYKSAFYDEAFEELTGKDKPDWFKYLYNKDASFKAAMKNRSKNKTLSNTEKDLKSMGISSNERANFIHDKIQGMEAKEKSAYLDDLKEKKILTSAVYKQLIKLKNK